MIQTTILAQSISNFTSKLFMIRRGTLLILGHRVKSQGQLWSVQEKATLYILYFMVKLNLYFVFRKIIHDLHDRCVSVTATTGMASLQLGTGSTTLHHWAGILDGRYGHVKLSELLQHDDSFADPRRRILTTHTLIIDEISMLSKKIFEMVEFVCRKVKDNNKVFGGLQVFKKKCYL